jgi:membrane protease YdiL (CAAX protease family)
MLLDLVQAAPHLELPLKLVPQISWFHFLLGYPAIKSLLPIPILLALVWPAWRLFGSTWRQLDAEAAEYRAELARTGASDFRPAACFALVAAILTIQEYYGGRQFFEQVIRPELTALDALKKGWLHLEKYDSLYSYGWWSLARILGYVVVPLICWRWWFPKDSLLDLGLRTGGLLKHSWIYFALLAVVIPVMLIVAQQPDFGTYYPFYKLSSRSWFDFLVWELMYYAQFFALEFFFRGWMVGALRRSLGASAIFAMSLPYCMIHYGKPYLEAHGAIVAGVVLGTLSMRTRSIYSGFALHVSVAALMDFLSLWKRGVLPQVFWAPD